ncbi:hypothetical protein LTR99_002657 [Exophiala xenobiotica]|uniref:C2H2-type domain-containing protein n=1 Tax=Vermiconidia calcicola TaxID=1690605 RepID=A0AAV9QEF1_9PEZI|nr:hypothetical protein LTR99_002657 [Exophiala xenobiotica]KAK5433774.1 hypothetical protein LTR34_003286 [Exophiala xenobiotica]KAK5536995.1 hypothetical protein LTR23_007692 [Chaetothyriales sp. CCFEE 6169]KAK5542006.1 hypothetical protein LTR25_001891 [Vermiconidia calcicola]
MENSSPNCRHGYPARSCLPEHANLYPQPFSNVDPFAQPFNNVDPFAQNGYGLNSSLSGALQFQPWATEAGASFLDNPTTIRQPDVDWGMWPSDLSIHCGKSYRNKGDRDRHVREAHTHRKRYLCHIAMCPRGVEGNGFARMTQLVVHLTGGSHKMGYDAARFEAARHNHNHNHNHIRNVDVNAASNH